MLSNLVHAAEVVGEEVHAVLAVNTADESCILFILTADYHHITEMASFLTNESEFLQSGQGLSGYSDYN